MTLLATGFVHNTVAMLPRFIAPVSQELAYPEFSRQFNRSNDLSSFKR